MYKSGADVVELLTTILKYKSFYLVFSICVDVYVCYNFYSEYSTELHYIYITIYMYC